MFSEVARVARFRGLPLVEEEMKEKLKDMEAGMDSFIESVSPEDVTLSKEATHCFKPYFDDRVFLGDRQTTSAHS